jgi:NAD-dependent dihydropyrimidine dehydrogenase PreA subunit
MAREDDRVDRGCVEVSTEECKGCGLCVDACPPQVMKLAEGLNARGYHPAIYLGHGCTGCGICFFACPEPGAITVFLLNSAAKLVVHHESSAVDAVH